MSLFEIRSSPGKGLIVFATQHIPAGTLVVREKPLLTWDASAPPYQVDRSLRASFHALSVPEKLAAGALHCPMDMARSVRMIKELRSSIEDARNNPGAQEAATLSPLKAKKGKGTMSPNYRTLMAEAMARSKDLTDPSKEDLELYIRATSDGIGYLGPGGGGKETGLFPTAARLNHSCDPNVVFAVDRHRQYHLRARHDIEIGSELVVNYMPSFLSSATRKRETLENHSFVCSCRRCRGATPTTTALITDGGGTVRQDPGRVAATTQVAVGFVSATHLRTFNLIQHQAAAGIGIDPDELHHWILDLQKQEQRLRSMAGAAEEPVELFGVLYSIAEAYCGLGLVLKSPADIDKAILCLEKAASLGSKHWGSDDVFVREQRECIMDLRVRQAGFPSKK